MSQSNDVREQLTQMLSKEVEIEGCQAEHKGDKCLHCKTSPCPHCKHWGGQQRTETRKMVDDKTIDQLASLLDDIDIQLAMVQSVEGLYKEVVDMVGNIRKQLAELQHPEGREDA